MTPPSKQTLFASPESVLAIGAHPDDIELSCAGFLTILKKKYGCRLFNVVFTAGNRKDSQDRLNEQKHANEMLGIEKSFLVGLRDGYLSPKASLVKKLEDIIEDTKPSLILTHAPNDHHQDHIAVSQLTTAATRRSASTLIFYPSVNTKENFPANLYVDITSCFKEKVLVLSKFNSQKHKWYLKKDNVRTRAREAGLVANFKYAEKFHIYFAVT